MTHRNQDKQAWNGERRGRPGQGKPSHACNLIVLFAVLVACALAQEPRLVKYAVNPNSGDGQYSFEYEVSDGTFRQESGTPQNVGTPDEFVAVQGTTTWTSPEGWTITIVYVADENGYRPKVQFSGSGGAGGSVRASDSGGFSTKQAANPSPDDSGIPGRPYGLPAGLAASLVGR